MLTQAKSAPGMVLRAELLDTDPYALCTPAGIVDLRTGNIRAPRPDKDFHSAPRPPAPKPSRPHAGSCSLPTPSVTTPQAAR